jgi:hypothetical protein
MALSADRIVPDTKQWNPQHGGYVINYTVGTSATVYVGSFVRLGTAGITPCAGTSTEPCLGIALEGGVATETVKVLVGAMIQHDVTSTTIANIGDPVYCSDDETLVLTSTTNEPFGNIIDFISGDTCVVLHRGVMAAVAPAV